MIKEYIEKLLADFARITSPMLIERLANEAASKAKIEVEIEGLKLNRDLDLEETEKFLDSFMYIFSETFGPVFVDGMLTRGMKRQELSVYLLLGTITLGMFFSSIILADLNLALAGLVILGITFIIEMRDIRYMPKKEERAFRICCRVLGIGSVLGWIAYIGMLVSEVPSAILAGVFAFICFCILVVISEPRIEKTEELVLRAVSSKIKRK